MDNVIPFNLAPKETSDSIYTRMVSSDEDLKKYWSHVCPGVGLVGLMNPVCDRCLTTKPEE